MAAALLKLAWLLLRLGTNSRHPLRPGQHDTTHRLRWGTARSWRKLMPSPGLQAELVPGPQEQILEACGPRHLKTQQGFCPLFRPRDPSCIVRPAECGLEGDRAPPPPKSRASYKALCPLQAAGLGSCTHPHPPELLQGQQGPQSLPHPGDWQRRGMAGTSPNGHAMQPSRAWTPGGGRGLRSNSKERKRSLGKSAVPGNGNGATQAQDGQQR